LETYDLEVRTDSQEAAAGNEPEKVKEMIRGKRENTKRRKLEQEIERNDEIK
jgi:hypothetical protein